jgi:hypothetical protein
VTDASERPVPDVPPDAVASPVVDAVADTVAETVVPPSVVDAVAEPAQPVAAPAADPVVVRDVSLPKPASHGQFGGLDLQPASVVAAAGGAIASAARVGRLFGRSGLRFARQLPGAGTLEREARRLQSYAAGEVRRVLQPPPDVQRPSTGAPRAPSAVERRAVEYVAGADPGADPLRSAMSELLERSVEATRSDSREYLFGTIISQLVPDEARILAALADGRRFAVVDVVERQRRGTRRVLLANASAAGRGAGLVSPDNVPTYLTRLRGFGLVEFGPEDDSLGVQYDILATDNTVQTARMGVEPRRRGSVRLVRKVVQMSALGREFWAASDPSRPALPPPS